jgi:hypothetical protein
MSVQASSIADEIDHACGFDGRSLAEGPRPHWRKLIGAELPTDAEHHVRRPTVRSARSGSVRTSGCSSGDTRTRNAAIEAAGERRGGGAVPSVGRGRPLQLRRDRGGCRRPAGQGLTSIDLASGRSLRPIRSAMTLFAQVNAIIDRPAGLAGYPADL